MSDQLKASAEVNGSEPFAEARGWVAVCESLPEMGVPVLAVLDTRVEILIRMKSQGVEGRWGWFRLTPGNGFSADWVKYWMPLPKPPNDEAQRRRDREASSETET